MYDFLTNQVRKMAKKNKQKEETQEMEETIVNEEIQENESPTIESLEIELAEAKDKYLRLFAEFDNFKKRNIKERLELMRNAAQDTMQTLLPVLDDFDRAKKSADDDSTEEAFSEGVTLVYNKLHSVLTAKGLKAMETEEALFDPELHEAITEIPAPTDEMKGKIIDTIEQGYYLNDKIIRYAKVVVGK